MGDGARGGCRTGAGLPKCDVHKDSGAPLDAPLRRFCSHCASPGSAWEAAEQGLRGLAGGMKGGYPAAPSTQLNPRCPLTRPPRAGVGGRSSLQALPVIRAAGKAGVGEARPDLSSWCVRVSDSRAALPGPSRPPAAGCLPRSTSAPPERASKAAQSCGAGELPDRERDKPLRSPACSKRRALG